MCISGIIDNEGRSACPICKQKIKFIDDIPACSQCRRLLYHNNAAEIQNKFYKTAEKMKNLADNNSEYLYKLGQKELDSTLSLSEQHIHDAWVAYNVAKLKAQYDMNNSPSYDEIAQSLYDFFEAAENVMKCMGL